MASGGLLGSTFNFVFETQMEALQSGDRFYYLARTAGLNFFTQLEENSFAELVMRNTGHEAPARSTSSRPWTTRSRSARPRRPVPRARLIATCPDGTVRFIGDRARRAGRYRRRRPHDRRRGRRRALGRWRQRRARGRRWQRRARWAATATTASPSMFGEDVMKGGDGNDAINAGAGDDLLLGGRGQ